jgi:hypothetical protein
MPWTWTARSWRTASEAGKFWRTSEFNKIETAIGRYSQASPNTQRLTKLKAILDAISAWRVYKQEKKGRSVGYASPRKEADRPDSKMAAPESKLREADVIGADEDLSVRSRVTDLLLRDVVEEIDAVLALERTAWGGNAFTDVSLVIGTVGAPQDFRYLVTAQSETSSILEYREAGVNNPALIADAVISASVITQNGVRLWGPSGFILSAPQKCVGAAAASDLATKNAVAWGHTLEKYREMLRVYLGEPGLPGAGLTAPPVLGNSAVKNEAVVLGRSYGETTTVAGVYVLVDEVRATVDEIVPARVGRVVVNLLRKGTTNVTAVVEGLPSTTDRRMEQYRTLNRNLGLPIIQIPTTLQPGPVAIDGRYMGSLYTGEVFKFPVPNDAVEHGTRAHLDMLAQRGLYSFTPFDKHDTTCAICYPR